MLQMLVPLAPRLLLLVLVSLQTHSTLFLVPASKYIHSRGHSRARRTVRRSSRSVSAAEDSRKASSEPSSSSEEEESEEEEVSPGPRTPTASRITRFSSRPLAWLDPSTNSAF